MLKGKKILLATMHQKELAIKELMESTLECEIIVAKDYDTDQFGTFSGEKERFLTSHNMVIHKAKIAIEHYSYDFAIASEGSFGPHPLIPFSPFHEELLCLVDSINDIEVVVKKQTNQTNYAMSEFTSKDTYDDFLSTYGFPSHAMIIRELASNQVIAKGIQELSQLESAVIKAFKHADTIRIETDMRAMFNPTRMQVIKELTYDLIKRIQSVCDNCGTYGFGETHLTGKLPCAECGSETQLFEKIIEKCTKCHYQIPKPRPDNLNLANPTFCDYCNP